MTERTEQLLRLLGDSRSILRAAVDSVPADRRDTRPAENQWSPAEVVEHLATANGGIARLIAKKIAAGKEDGTLGVEAETSPIETASLLSRWIDRTSRFTAPTRIVPTGTLRIDRAWAALEATDAELKAAVLAGDGLTIGTISSPHPAFGPLSLYQWIVFVAAHEQRHAAQIKEI